MTSRVCSEQFFGYWAPGETPSPVVAAMQTALQNGQRFEVRDPVAERLKEIWADREQEEASP